MPTHFPIMLPEQKDTLEYLLDVVLDQQASLILNLEYKNANPNRITETGDRIYVPRGHQAVEVYRTINPWTKETMLHVKFLWTNPTPARYQSKFFEAVGNICDITKMLLEFREPEELQQYKLGNKELKRTGTPKAIYKSQEVDTYEG